jgi:glycosyltransferase involved in cell wall biosynthesis
MPLKVLQLINSFSTGGAELMVKRLALALDPKHVRNDIWSLVAMSTDATRIYCDGLDEHGVAYHCIGKTPRKKDPRVVMTLVKQLRRERYDIVHMHCAPPAFYGRLAASLVPGTKRLVAIHNHLNRLEATRERLFSLLTDYFIACSSEAEADLRDACKIRDSKFSCILNGTAGDRTAHVTKAREAIRREHGIEPHERVAIVLARLEEQKAHLDLMEALVQPGEYVQQLKLWLVGNDETPYADLVRRSIAEKNLQSRVQILGRVEDHEVDELIKGADLFLMPSHREGMSVAILEALAAGLPTVVSDLGTNREVTDNGRVGWLTPPGDPQGLARDLDRLLASPEAMKERAREAVTFVQERFSFDRVVREYVEAYEALVSK